MKKCFSIGGLVISIEYEKGFVIDKVMKVFAVKSTSPDVSVSFTGWKPELLAKSESVGKDVHYRYFNENGVVQAQKMHGSLGFCSVVRFSPDFKTVECSLLYTDVAYTAMMLFQHIPMKVIYAAFDIMMLHSSQICINGKSILFTAPSGTGKTTQSDLWKKHQNALQLSGDRSAIKQKDGVIYSYGFPLDGSNPVLTNKPHEIGAIVVLRQAQENKVEKLKAANAFRFLLEQSSVPYWDKTLINRATEMLYVVLVVVPTYILYCTPDENAVNCLKARLESDGII